MTNKEFDRWLKESLSSVRPETTPQDWEHFIHQVEESESEFDSGFDETIRTALTQVSVASVPDWEKMEQQLDADEHQFDQHVRESVEQFEVPYSPHTWPTLHAKLSEEDRLRRHLIVAKIFEIAAVFIVFLTFYNFFPALKTWIIDPAENLIRKELLKNDSVAADHATTGLDSGSSVFSVAGIIPDKASETLAIAEEVLLKTQQKKSDAMSTGTIPFAGVPVNNSKIIESVELLTQNVVDHQIISTPLPQHVASADRAGADVSGANTLDSKSNSAVDVFPMLNFPESQLSIANSTSVHSLAFVMPQIARISKVRFGMMASADVNTLFFPEEHFYSQGRSINFSEKEIVAGGYSASVSLLFDFNRCMIETGLTYSSKTFGPDRNLFIGTSADRHSLDFENISLNVVSLPLYLHWKLDGKGLWRVYATGGASLHVIANANYDLIAENIYTSSAVQSGQQLQNIREVQRVREHMRDGAKFSSKGYLTAVGGFGVERYLNGRMSVFAQPMYQYQIPFFGLIDQNGKHLQNGSLLLGTRISL